ncbi:MAG: AAA family ATPase, partial [Symploca sp. SIO3E6]|nr:AAA family ATPase [Caldora sp. SIO3E6]
MTATPQYRKNPYIIGRPISEPELFFGRESLFGFINDNLNQGTKVILLHGQRRIGKSSVLFQIPNFVGKNKFVFVSFDLHDQGKSSLPQILHNLAKDISKQLRLSPDTFKVPPTEELATAPTTLFRDFLAEVHQALGDKSLVLLLDEFDVLSTSEHHQGFDNFFRYLQSILEQEDKLFVIPVVGQSLKDLQNLPLFYKRAPQQKIGLLDESSAKKLITEPAQRVLDYEPDAIQAIWKLSAGHPYCIQVICHAVFAKARERDPENWTITRTDVENIINKAIEIGEGGLIWFWDGLSIRERIVFSAVAEVQASQQPEESSTVSVNAEQCWEYLKNLGVVLTESLHKAESQLVKENLLQREYLSQKSGQKAAGLKVTIEIVRRWIVKQHPLHREVRELEMLDSEANRIYKTSAELRQQGADIHKQINHYERVLELNPNHFSALSDLAQGYLEIPDFANAIRVYERAYKVDPIRTKDEYLRSLLSYGSQLMEQREFRRAVNYYSLASDVAHNNKTVQKKLVDALDSYGRELMEPQCQLARQQFERILQLEPDNQSAKMQFEKCDQGNSKGNPLVLGSIATVIVAVIFSFGWLVRGEREATNIVTVANSSSEQGNIDNDNCPTNFTESIHDVDLCISYGERLLISSSPSEDFQQGMKAFREAKAMVKEIKNAQTDDLSVRNEDRINKKIDSVQEEYKKADEFFKKAAQLSNTEKDSKDSKYSIPEALIYSNNARALAQEGSPLTLAVVVPGDDELLARAILQGVAQ